MSTFKFIHAADIHLDSPLKGLERYEGAPVESIRGAARTAFRNLIDLAIQESVDFVLIAGDLYDGNWKDYSTGLFFGNSMGRLRQAGIPVFMIRGNHDAQSVITRSLSLPDNVHVFSESAPETKQVEGLGVAIHGQSFATQAVDADLAAAYPEAVPGAFN
ncbi:MAG: DNA repair exonuclease, partial [Candidatus Hydrogenedentes bacterium]|nr:DNA repair exonuclease [Candidatus Hydrogenedentota bacterium]